MKLSSAAKKKATIASTHTFADLWYQYTVAAFSSQAESDKGTAGHLFAAFKNPLHSLKDVAGARADGTWIAEQFEEFAQQCKAAKVPAFGFVKAKTTVIIKAFSLFAEAGGPDDALAECCRGKEELRVFCDLARGTVGDRSLVTSARFSKLLDPSAYAGLSHKQIRIMLLSSGLCSNVLPLDSRWKRFLEDKAQIPLEGDLGKKDYYEAVEDMLRQALISILTKNPDFPVKDLATLDAVACQYLD